jgi:hypothetical protein
VREEGEAKGVYFCVLSEISDEPENAELAAVFFNRNPAFSAVPMKGKMVGYGEF